MNIKIQSPFKLTKSVNKSINTGSDSKDEAFFQSYSNGFGAAEGENLAKLKIIKYFIEVPELYMAISLKASMFSKGKYTVVNKVTGDPIENDLSKLIANPNFHQGQKEFLMQTKVFRELFGNEYIYGFKGVGITLPSQLNTLDNSQLEIDPDYVQSSESNILKDEADQFNYIYTDAGQELTLSNEDIIHVNNPSISSFSDFKNSIVGLSPIIPLAQALNNIKGAYESRGKLIHNRGPLNILSNDSKPEFGSVGPMDEPSKDQLHNDFKRYGMLKDQWSSIITNLSLKSNVIGSNVKDLMLFEETEADFQVILGALKMRRELFPNTKGSTFENQKEAEKATYEDTIIPDAEEWVSALNNFFNTENEVYEIRVDFKHLSIFQSDLKDKGIAMKFNTDALTVMLLNGGITKDQYIEELAKLL